VVSSFATGPARPAERRAPAPAPRDKAVERPKEKAGKAPARDDFTLASVNGLEKVTLTGRYRKVKIDEINGLAEVDTQGLEAEEIEIGAINGASKVSLKLASGKLKKLKIGKVDGACKVDCGGLEADAVEVSSVGGASQLTLRSLGRITVAEGIGGAARVTVPLCRDFHVAGLADGASSVEVNYFGEASCSAVAVASVVLNKVAPPGKAAKGPPGKADKGPK
jgi:hypothetical protein